MRIGEIIIGFVVGLMIWLVTFIIALGAGALLKSSLAAIAFFTVLLLLVPAIVLFRKIGKSGLVTGMVIALAIGILLSALCGFSNPKFGG